MGFLRRNIGNSTLLFVAVLIAAAPAGVVIPQVSSAATACVEEGAEGWTFPKNAKTFCCPGLRAVKLWEDKSSGWLRSCTIPEGKKYQYVCVRCGDGVCGEGENRCNCSRDCGPVARCGNGILDVNEQCDDRNWRNGDGCAANCTVEEGWYCAGAPSTCGPRCGDGVVSGSEECDDGNHIGGDGCSASCRLERGWTCTGAFSACLLSGETQRSDCRALPDGATVWKGDGCSVCTCRNGREDVCTRMLCSGVSDCGNGVVDLAAGETCDDGNRTNGDGCNVYCRTESAFICRGQPSVCLRRPVTGQ